MTNKQLREAAEVPQALRERLWREARRLAKQHQIANRRTSPPTQRLDTSAYGCLMLTACKEIATLTAERDAMREALKPFARLSKAALENELPANILSCNETPVFSVGLAYADEWAVEVSVGDLRRAAKAGETDA